MERYKYYKGKFGETGKIEFQKQNRNFVRVNQIGPCRHVYKTTSHAGRQLSSTNRAFRRNDYFDGRLLNLGTKREFR